MLKKQDCMGRDLNENALVVVSYTGKMELGVVLKNTVRTLNSIEKAVGRKKCYILTNPTQKELQIKQEIIDKFNDYQHKKYLNKKQKSKPTFGTLIGGVYSTDEGAVYLYLGNITVSDFDKNGNHLRTRSGNCYRIISYTDHIGLDIQSINFEEIFGVNKEYDFLQFNKGYKRINGLKGIHKYFKNIQSILGVHNLQYEDNNTRQTEYGIRKITINK